MRGDQRDPAEVEPDREQAGGPASAPTTLYAVNCARASGRPATTGVNVRTTGRKRARTTAWGPCAAKNVRSAATGENQRESGPKTAARPSG